MIDLHMRRHSFLPAGVSQWDPETRKYFFVELSTGVVQWDPPAPERSAGTGRAARPASRSAAQQSDGLEVPQARHRRVRLGERTVSDAVPLSPSGILDERT